MLYLTFIEKKENEWNILVGYNNLDRIHIYYPQYCCTTPNVTFHGRIVLQFFLCFLVVKYTLRSIKNFNFCENWWTKPFQIHYLKTIKITEIPKSYCIFLHELGLDICYLFMASIFWKLLIKCDKDKKQKTLNWLKHTLSQI